MLFDDEEDDIRGWTPTRAPGTSYSLGDGAIVRSPIVTRRAISTWTGGGQERRKAGIDSMRLAEDEMGYTPVRPPLFEVHFEMNPRDPEYDAKIYLAIDQVKCAAAVMVPHQWATRRACVLPLLLLMIVFR